MSWNWFCIIERGAPVQKSSSIANIDIGLGFLVDDGILFRILWRLLSSFSKVLGTFLTIWEGIMGFLQMIFKTLKHFRFDSARGQVSHIPMWCMAWNCLKENSAWNLTQKNEKITYSWTILKRVTGKAVNKYDRKNA